MSKTTETLASALLAAQKALPSVGKDAKNSFHHYAYTSAEGMISACREALHGAGLTVRRAGWKFDGTPEGGLVHSQFVLAHGPSGESVTDEVTWIAVPEKGRPVDKAFAGALTSSLGYYLRDLLLVPREDESEMDRRDDRAYEPRKAAAPARSNPATPSRTDGGNAPARQAAQDAPQAAPAPKTAAAPAPAQERATAAPSAFSEVMASRPAKDCAWKGGLTVRKVGQGKATANGSMRYPILFDGPGGEQWASCFDTDLMQAAQDALGGERVEAFIQDGKFGWTLYGLRTAVQSEQPAAATVPAEDSIPF
jgi:hypothetical protein